MPPWQLPAPAFWGEGKNSGSVTLPRSQLCDENKKMEDDSGNVLWLSFFFL